MHVALVKSPDKNNFARGVGFYVSRLYAGLNNLGVSVDFVDYSCNPLGFSKFDIVHFSYFDPFFLTLPIVLSKKVLVTVHDLTPLIFPNEFPSGLHGEIKWQIQKFLLKRVDAIITVSNSSKSDIERIINFNAKKIFVTYEAADEVFKKKYNVKKENSILYVGDLNYNKNISTLIDAFALLPNKFTLVLVGKSFVNEDLFEAQEIKKQIIKLNLAKRIVLKGFVTPVDLVDLYNKAAVYVQPSIYEGFGLPILEAMACGTPVVCGQNSSMPEVAGEAAVYADVTDPDDLATKILQAEKPPSSKLVSQAAKFSWLKTANETLAVYKKVLQ